MSVDREVTVSTVVCAYTDARRELLNNSIESILAQLRPDDQLVVVIDYNDELLARVSGQYGTRATVVPNRNSKGICGARNAGIEASRCDVIAFVDDDAEVQPGWLERLREDYRDPQVTGVGAMPSRFGPTNVRHGFGNFQLGGWLQSRRPSGGPGAGAKPARLQHVVSPRRSRCRGRFQFRNRAGRREPDEVRRNGNVSGSTRKPPRPCCCSTLRSGSALGVR